MAPNHRSNHTIAYLHFRRVLTVLCLTLPSSPQTARRYHVVVSTNAFCICLFMNLGKIEERSVYLLLFFDADYSSVARLSCDYEASTDRTMLIPVPLRGRAINKDLLLQERIHLLDLVRISVPSMASVSIRTRIRCHIRIR